MSRAMALTSLNRERTMTSIRCGIPQWLTLRGRNRTAPSTSTLACCGAPAFTRRPFLGTSNNNIDVDPDVRQALREGRPVVALESTIISHGMPYPENLEMARSVESIVRGKGAVPATVAILEGRPLVGLTSKQLEVLARAGPLARKCSRRDLAVAVAQRVDGATTVAATAYLAALAGIRVFVTGGMGGVHRGAETTFDVSADLSELAQTPIVVVCAGVKSILDVGRTLEVLETNGVPVVSYGCDEFPAFFSPSSGVRSPLRLDTPLEVATAAKAGFDLGMKNGMIVAVPNPSPAAGGARVDAAIRVALSEADSRGLTGRDVTPFVLARVNEKTGGESLKSNVALVRHNARVGTDIAIHLANLESSPSSVPLQQAPSTATPRSIPPTSQHDHNNAANSSIATENQYIDSTSPLHRPPFPLAADTDTPATPIPKLPHQQQLVRPPRVAVFGGAVVDIIARPRPGSVLAPGTSTPGDARQTYGGVGRNVAEALARLLGLGQSGLSGPGPVGENVTGGVADTVIDSNRSDDSAEVTLVSVVGADETGKALVAHCEDAGVKARATVEIRRSATKPDVVHSLRRGLDRSNEEKDEESLPGTASYVAMLDGDGELVAAVADMRLLDVMTAEFVDRHANTVAGTAVVVADGNLPPGGLARLVGLCRREGTPLVFEPTSVVKSVRPFASGTAAGITVVTPNLDELAVMAAAAATGRSRAWKDFRDSPSVAELSQEPAASRRAGHQLAQAALSAEGCFLDARPLGDSLRTVLMAMIHDGSPPSDADAELNGALSSAASSAPCPALDDGSKHVVVTMGSAGVLVASARRVSAVPERNKTRSNRSSNNPTLVEIPAHSGSSFELSAKHYPALPLPPQSGGTPGVLVDCTGAGDCLVAGMVGAISLGWELQESVLLGLLCARESVQAEIAVPASLGTVLLRDIGTLRSRLPAGYTPRSVDPWST